MASCAKNSRGSLPHHGLFRVKRLEAHLSRIVENHIETNKENEMETEAKDELMGI